MAYTNIDDPSAHFQTALYTGNSSYNTITNDGNSDLAPDIIWGKCRSATKTHYFYDSIRGVENRVEPDNSGNQDSSTNGVLNFQTDGFRLGSGNTENDNGETFAAWQWKVNGGTVANNTDGNITTSVQTNLAAGISIGTYEGTSTNGKTIGHGLGAIPDLFMIKGYSGPGTKYWVIGAPNHPNFLNNSSKHVFLDTTNAVMNNTTMWGNVAFTSTTAPLNSHQAINHVGSDYMFYAFKNIQGYSKIGHYIGNGSNSGPFIYTGFKPAFVLIKNLDATQVWIMYDGARKPVNRDDNVAAIYASETSAEYTGASYHNLDILSNGFKIRLTDASQNGNGVDYLYMAFAENPFTTSTGIPTTAR